MHWSSHLHRKRCSWKYIPFNFNSFMYLPMRVLYCMDVIWVRPLSALGKRCLSLFLNVSKAFKVLDRHSVCHLSNLRFFFPLIQSLSTPSAFVHHASTIHPSSIPSSIRSLFVRFTPLKTIAISICQQTIRSTISARHPSVTSLPNIPGKMSLFLFSFLSRRVSLLPDIHPFDPLIGNTNLLKSPTSESSCKQKETLLILSMKDTAKEPAPRKDRPQSRLSVGLPSRVIA